MPSPNQESTIHQDERKIGIISDGVSEEMPLALGLTPKEVLSIIGKRVPNSESWWNSELQIDVKRKASDDYYLGNTYSDEDLYDFQVPYKNNRILTAVEVLLPMLTAQIPQPIVTEGNDTDASRELARDLEDTLIAQYEDMGIKQAITMALRHLLGGQRAGILKLYFDSDGGQRLPDGTRKGAITCDYVRPAKVVFDAEASDPENIPLIAEYMTATIEELCIYFPMAKAEIYKHFGIKKGTKQQLARRVGYQSVEFTYYKDGQPEEAIAWVVGQELYLDARKNPNWNYDEFEKMPDGKYRRLNYLDAPRKSYFLLNHINLGKYVLDDTSLAEQAHPLQDVLEKRGRQIVENADQAASGLVLNSAMISIEDAKRLIGDPSEKIMVDGDVNKAATRLPYNPLPQYVINDKADARMEIDNIFGANAPLRGEASGSDTLGAEVLSQRANSGRLQTITNAVERLCSQLYPFLVQMMKVYWDEDEIVRYTPAEGKTRFISWNSTKVEDGVKVRVKEGSAMPKDRQQQKTDAIALQPTLDPLTLAEMMHLPNPKEIAKRVVYYKFFMDKYVSEVLGDDGSLIDPQAISDMQNLMGGSVPPLPENPSKLYLSTMQNVLESATFEQIPDIAIKQQMIQFAKAVNDKAKTGIGEMGEPVSEQTPAAPTPAEEEGAVPVEGQIPPTAPPPSNGQIPA